MNSRISVTEETRDKFRDFVHGLGMQYDEAIRFMMDTLSDGEMNPLLAGGKLRTSAEEWRNEKTPHEGVD